MAQKRAFALKESVKDFAGGSVAVPPDGRTLDLKARLDNSDGVIVVSDADEAQALSEHDALKEVAVPSGKKGGDS